MIDNTKKNLAIIILNYNGADDTKECLKTLKQITTNFTYNVYILDNGSEKSDKEKLKDNVKNYKHCGLDEFLYSTLELENTLILSNENWGFAQGNNLIIEKVKYNYDYVLLLNNDTVVVNCFVDIMLNFMYDNSEIKFASCRINSYYDKEKLWNCGGKLYFWGNRHYYTENELLNYGEVVPATFITGCALFVDTNLIRQEKCFTDKFFFGEEDIEFCLRMKNRKVKGACVNKVLVYHKVGATTSREAKNPGKIALHFSNRVINMKSFYPKTVWYIWKMSLIILLKIKCMTWGFSRKETSKIIKLVNENSKNDRITKNEAFRLMRFEE